MAGTGCNRSCLDCFATWCVKTIRGYWALCGLCGTLQIVFPKDYNLLFREQSTTEVLASLLSSTTSEAHLLLQALLSRYYLSYNGIDRRFIRPGAHDEGLEGGDGRAVGVVRAKEGVSPR